MYIVDKIRSIMISSSEFDAATSRIDSKTTSLSRLINHLRVARFLVMSFAPAPFTRGHLRAFRSSALRLFHGTRPTPDPADRFARTESAESGVSVLDLVESLF